MSRIFWSNVVWSYAGHEIPEFRQFVSEHPDIPVLGIAVDGSVNKLRQFAKQNRMNYPVLRRG